MSCRGILPPQILTSIIENGTPQQRRRALATLAVSERLRGRRELLAHLLVPPPAGQKRRAVYDAQHRTRLPGALVRSEGDPASDDVAVNEAYDGAGATDDLYRGEFDRDSIDGRGMRIDSTVHYGVQYDNAFWDGAQMVYGDGDGELFERFTKSIDVIGHELTHGVTDSEAALEYHDQPGALNESFSDVFGSLVKQRERRQSAAEADWIIGEGLFTARVRGIGLRSLPGAGIGVRGSRPRQRPATGAHERLRRRARRQRRRARQLGDPQPRFLSGRRLDRRLCLGESGPDLVRRADRAPAEELGLCGGREGDGSRGG